MAISGGYATDGIPVTKSDTTIVAAKVLYIGTTGDLTIDTATKTDVLFKAVAVGFFPVFTQKVKVATTAADIVALY